MSHGDVESEKAFPNGDVYNGFFDGTLPHRHGKYTWSDGAIYEGEWENGKLTGKGYIFWSSGSVYEGELCGGFLHGYGTFSSIDGSVYKGSWRLNAQHGLGTKTYPNSDVYEGSWGEGHQKGIGKYIWGNGNMYVGSWKEGRISGRGVMKWMNGDLFYGHWLDGLEHGIGYYYFADGSCYLGTWSKGLKDGRGTYYPAGSRPPYRHTRYKSYLCNDCTRYLCPPLSVKYATDESVLPGFSLSREVLMYKLSTYTHKASISIETETKQVSSISNSVSWEEKNSNFSMRKICSLLGHSGKMSNRPTTYDGYCDFGDSFGSISLSDKWLTHFTLSNGGQSELQNDVNVVYEREYMQGVLKMERMVNQHLLKPGINKRLHKNPKNPVGGRGETIYRGHKSYYLMLNLQLGIRYTVGKITPVPVREVHSSDFGPRARIRMYFPHKGSQFTPTHNSVSFHWKDYCLMVFRNLREMFKIDAADYMVSLCGGDGLKEISSPGKSGSIFYLSQDERFVIKTLKKSELKALLKMLPKYYDHVGAYDNTLITKVFGLHRITVNCGQKIRFVVMGNMFCTELRIHRRYDLKGSTHGRSTNSDKINESTTLKDLDLSYVFHLEKSWRESLFRQISLDCTFLESQSIIDYSMLLGLHLRAPECLRSSLKSESKNESPSLIIDNFGTYKLDELMIPSKGLLLVAHEPGSLSGMPGSHIRGSTLRAAPAGDEEREVDLLLPGTGRLRVQLGVNMPAQASRRLLREGGSDSSEADLFKAYDVVLYLGIIDILQEYNMTKKVEHACKSIKLDPLTISAVEPKLYASRFIAFLEKVFPEHI
ncbi:Phosphatidylinositol 4-phosphate 5-kinase 1 [Platanthera guangdongensis]|uniref:Phosphatidylinositol 4-phosphate 5-kinase n=1 Tax=Platanthera guangdongensis TaxID=2320717 RepID=A0ABR2MSM2_9ASPA